MTRLAQDTPPAHFLTTESSAESQLRILLSSLQEQSQNQLPSHPQTQKSGDFFDQHHHHHQYHHHTNSRNNGSNLGKHTVDSLARLVVWTCIYWDLLVLLSVAVGSVTYSSYVSQAGQRSIQLFITRVTKSIAYQTLRLKGEPQNHHVGTCGRQVSTEARRHGAPRLSKLQALPTPAPAVEPQHHQRRAQNVDALRLVLHLLHLVHIAGGGNDFLALTVVPVADGHERAALPSIAFVAHGRRPRHPHPQKRRRQPPDEQQLHEPRQSRG
ncbi:hypothetical protein PG987_006241 [Apiospora arundinis]